LTLEVTWRSGLRSVVSPVQPNRLYEIDESFASDARPVPGPASAPPFFKEVASFQHEHHEEAFDDFARQSLLSRRLSQLGPGVAWFDLDNDGWEDLVIGSGRGGELTLFHNRQGQLERTQLGRALGQASDDLTAVLGWPTDQGSSTFWVAQANYESGQTNLALRRYEVWPGAVE